MSRSSFLASAFASALAIGTLIVTPTAASSYTATTPNISNSVEFTTLSSLDTTRTEWSIDAVHSELSFSVRHLVSRVRGQFSQWNGKIIANKDDWSTASIEIAINVSSVNTNNAKRDAHLRNSDFFDVATHPRSTFKSTKVERKGDSISVSGDLTLRGVTKPIVLKGKFLGTAKEANGKLRMGFNASTVINRKDFGVSWNSAVEAGGVTLGDDVTIDINFSAVQL